ncbi:DUF4176 domain-containing protein [Streptococcus uberis]|uniref:DUF4176 domain-containing protein n=1 Tax=Streptococcus uberis TaxID=1349 RepID=UPI001FF6CDD4|nr:DUF4176 domain-containing protein [Streptococcus uberis]MCK1162037.1 DUF4176 domain-containing protein [Streptococcus uberis]MCK1233931.1 DUF4176 domain-containing protein [Streptococcus uberis]MCK1251949.1 DUF4176 domain-containing protein [Streptococcus uberis]MCK1253113.1 DUF4176 domain-containing protein [Streptococcus uberis]
MRLYPLGTIIYLKDGNQKLMIVSRGVIIEQDGKRQLFDYSACLYPYGLDINNIFYFNQDDIKQIIFEGFCDEDDRQILEMYENWKTENSENYTKGITH